MLAAVHTAAVDVTILLSLGRHVHQGVHGLRLGQPSVLALILAAVARLDSRIWRERWRVTLGRGVTAGPRAGRRGLGGIAPAARMASVVACSLANDIGLHGNGASRAVKLIATGKKEWLKCTCKYYDRQLTRDRMRCKQSCPRRPCTRVASRWCGSYSTVRPPPATPDEEQSASGPHHGCYTYSSGGGVCTEGRI